MIPPAKTVTSTCESIPFIDQRFGPIHQRRLGAIHHNNMMPSTSDTMPSISESVTHCQSRKVTKQSFHGLNETLCQPRAGECRARAALVSDVKHWKCSILGGRPWYHYHSTRLLFLLFLFSDYWYFYNVSFMLEIIVVNCIVLHYYNTYNISN